MSASASSSRHSYLLIVCVLLFTSCMVSPRAWAQPPQVFAKISLPDALDDDSTLTELVVFARANNPDLFQLQARAEAAWSRVPQMRALPDPMIGVNVFGHAIETAAGSQRSNVTISQRLPWFKRLNAQGAQAAVEAQAIEQAIAAEKLKLVAQVKTTAYQIYQLGQELQINQADQEVLRSLAQVASARVRAGAAGQNDVLRANLEFSRLAQERVSLHQQMQSTKAKLNQLLDRSATSPVPVLQQLEIEPADFDVEGLVAVAMQNQPELLAAQLRLEAAQIGVNVAHLMRVPELNLTASWLAMDDNRPPSTVVDVGKDAWFVGAMVNIPLWKKKYNAMQTEAEAESRAALAEYHKIRRRYEAMIADLVEQARAASDNVTIYENSILPQARQTLEADQSAYQQGSVDFDRVVTDFRNLLNYEVGYHRARTQLAIATAQIEQAIGIDTEALRGGPRRAASVE